MNPNEYQENVLRTVSPKCRFWDEEESKVREDKRLNLLINSALGMLGEMSEFVDKPSIDEAGDCAWYTGGLCKALDIEMGDLDMFTTSATILPQPGHEFRWLVKHAGDIAESVKKIVFHDKPIDQYRQKLHSAASGYIVCVSLIVSRELGSSIEHVFQFNIEKLKARYPDGFDSTRK